MLKRDLDLETYGMPVLQKQAVQSQQGEYTDSRWYSHSRVSTLTAGGTVIAG